MTVQTTPPAATAIFLRFALCVLLRGINAPIGLSASSFRIDPPSPPRPPTALSSGTGAAAANTADDGVRSQHSGARSLAETSILGETLGVSLRNRGGTTYSLSRPEPSLGEEDPRVSRQSTPHSPAAASDKDQYERISFDGCGSILLRHQRGEFPGPPRTFIDDDKGAASGEGHSRKRKDQTGATLWSASYVISSYIDAQCSSGGSWSDGMGAVDASGGRRRTVLELGAGLGLCSAVAARHGMDVVSTDGNPAVLEVLEENVRRNRIHDDGDAASGDAASSSASTQHTGVHLLDWAAVADDPLAETSHPALAEVGSLGGADLIILSDVVYGATRPAWGAVLALLGRLRAQRRRLAADGDDDDGPLVLLGYTQRRRDISARDEARFFSMARAAGMEAALIPMDRVPGGERYMMTSLFELRWAE